MGDGPRKFRWRDLGDIAEGRPHLGGSARLEMYRLLQFTVRHVLEKEWGREKADEVLREAGRLAGSAFRRHFLPPTDDLAEYVRELQEVLRMMGVGILRVEEADPAKGTFVLTISEDMDCSGVGEGGREMCVYSEGFVEALVEGFTGRRYHVREVDCWSTGERTCRFVASSRE